MWIRCVGRNGGSADLSNKCSERVAVTSPWSVWRLWPNKFPEDKEDDAHAEFTEDGGGS